MTRTTARSAGGVETGWARVAKRMSVSHKAGNRDPSMTVLSEPLKSERQSGPTPEGGHDGKRMD